MKTESEIKKMLEHTLASDLVSPTVIDTLEWVLSITTDEDCKDLLDLKASPE